MSTLFTHHPHPYVEERKALAPATVAQQLPSASAAARFNSWLAVKITAMVGTMWCAYVFAAIALVGLPAVLGSSLVPARFSSLVLWVSSEFLQLVLLAVIIVGQNIQSQAADKRSEATYEDAAAVLHESIEIEKHLEVQDEVIQRILALVLSGNAPSGEDDTRDGAPSPPDQPTP